MQSAKSYVKDTGGSLRKIKELEKVDDGATLITADVVGFYPSLPLEDGLDALSEKHSRIKNIEKEHLLKMDNFFFEEYFFLNLIQKNFLFKKNFLIFYLHSRNDISSLKLWR